MFTSESDIDRAFLERIRDVDEVDYGENNREAMSPVNLLSTIEGSL